MIYGNKYQIKKQMNTTYNDKQKLFNQNMSSNNFLSYNIRTLLLLIKLITNSV